MVRLTRKIYKLSNPKYLELSNFNNTTGVYKELFELLFNSGIGKKGVDFEDLNNKNVIQLRYQHYCSEIYFDSYSLYNKTKENDINLLRLSNVDMLSDVREYKIGKTN